MARIERRIDDLLLDQDNPRIGHVDSQAEALAAIIELDRKHFKTMMRSITDHGLDPGDSFYVVDEDNDKLLTVVDGNRRLAALKVLAKPTLLKGTGLAESILKPLEKQAEGFDKTKFKALSCYQFNDRSVADEWIVRRHGNEQGGEGRIPWGPLEIQRFQKDKTLLDVIDFVEKNTALSAKDWAAQRKAVEKRPYVLRRVVDSKIGRTLLGLSETTDKDGFTRAATDQNAKHNFSVLSKVFEDIEQGTISTRTLNKSKDIENYLAGITTATPSAPAKGAKPIVIADLSTKSIAATATPPAKPSASTTAAQTKTTKVQPIRDTLAPKRYPFKTPSNTKAQQLLREASSTKLADKPLSCAFLLRAFIQHAVDTYMDANKLPYWVKSKPTDAKANKQLDLKERTSKVIEHLIAAKLGKATELRGVSRTLNDGSHSGSIQALNDVHHDKYQVPTTDTLRKGWDSADALFIAIFGAA